MCGMQRVMARESHLGTFLFVSGWAVTALLPGLFSKQALCYISP